MKLNETCKEMLQQARDFGRVDVERSDETEWANVQYLVRHGTLEEIRSGRIGRARRFALTREGEHVAATVHAT